MKRSTKTLLVAVMVMTVAMFSLVGCTNTPQERVSTLQGWIDTGQNLSEGMDAQIDQIDQMITDAQTKLADPAIAFDQKEKVTEAIEKAILAEKVLIEKKALIDADLIKWNGMLKEVLAGGDVDISTEFKQYGAMVNDTAKYMPVPVNYVFMGIGALISGIGGMIAVSKKNKKLNSANKVLEDVVQSEAKMMTALEGSGGEAAVKVAKTTLYNERDSATLAVLNDVENGFIGIN